MYTALIDGERRGGVLADLAIGQMSSAGKAARWQREARLLTSVPGFGDVVTQAWLGEIGPAPHRHFATGTTGWPAASAGTRTPPRRSAKKKAITAIAHTLLKIAHQVLKSGTPYRDLGADFFTRRESPTPQPCHRSGRGRHPRVGPRGRPGSTRAHVLPDRGLGR
jgi:hypothetical protein